MIRPFITLLFLINLPIALAMADTRAAYTITDIEVDESASSVIEAQQAAFASARIIGVRSLFNKITLQEDRARAGGLVVDGVLAERLAVAVDVQEETRGGGRYRGTLSVLVNPQLARAHLQSRGVPYIDRQAPLALVAPVAASDLRSPWLSAWGVEETIALAPYKVSIISYGRDVMWQDLQAELAQTGAERGVIAEYLSRNRVRLTLVTAVGNTYIGTTGAAPDMETAIRRASSLLDNSWKQQSIIRTSMRTIREAEILYTSLAEWNKLRGALLRSPFISDFQVNAVARTGAAVTFAYAGDVERLGVDLRQRGVSIDTNPSGWILTSAVIGGR